MGNQTTLWVQQEWAVPLTNPTDWRPATRDELVAALSQIDGAEPDYEAVKEAAVKEVLFLYDRPKDHEIRQQSRVIVDILLRHVVAALAGRLVIPVGEEPK